MSEVSRLFYCGSEWSQVIYGAIRVYESWVQEVHFTREDESTHNKFVCHQAQN